MLTINMSTISKHECSLTIKTANKNEQKKKKKKAEVEGKKA